ncbi:MAG: ATP-dependent DNA ligase [Myxococcales bacterium]|nr:ATP-dependent DNA ligase [Myxococcales bacterium]MCB9733151.1 hypothetical protein [Deltaproteobacteria bacterium]
MTTSRFYTVAAPYGGGALTDPGALTDGALMAELTHYKRAVAKRHRLVSPDQLERFLPEGELFVSTKVDGELWFLAKRGGEVALIAFNGRVLTGVPVVTEAAQQLAGVESGLFAGELFAVSRGGGRPRVQHVGQALRDEARAGELGFKVFDLIELDGEAWLPRSFGARWERLEQLFGQGRRCASVTTERGDKARARALYVDWVQSGRFEGLVVRSEVGVGFKVKPEITIDAVVVAYAEGKNGEESELRELHLALLREDGDLHLLGSVGSGLDGAARAEWGPWLEANQVPASYRLASREHTLCTFVRPEKVVEVRVSDLLAGDVADEPTRRMVLRYAEGAGYEPLEPMPIPAMIHPVYKGSRPDKTVTPECVGMQQIDTWLLPEPAAPRPQATTTSAATTLERQVWKKVWRGATMVRKVLVLRREDGDPQYPPFIVHFTDYSAGRKDALQTSLRVASTESRARELAAGWIEENVKRGWEPA